MTRKNLFHFGIMGGMILLVMVISACSKNVTQRQTAYFNDFEGDSSHQLVVFGSAGRVDTSTIYNFNNNKVFGRFRDNAILFKLDSLPKHNVVKIEFDLFLHDNWKGNFLAPGSQFPDIWQMKLHNNPIIVTTFSNDSNPQSFPNDYQNNMINNPALANSWGVFPGVCAKQNLSNGTSWYKIEYITGHTGSLEISLQDVNFSAGNLCSKSWSIDNLKITAIYN